MQCERTQHIVVADVFLDWLGVGWCHRAAHVGPSSQSWWCRGRPNVLSEDWKCSARVFEICMMLNLDDLATWDIVKLVCFLYLIS